MSERLFAVRFHGVEDGHAALERVIPKIGGAIGAGRWYGQVKLDGPAYCEWRRDYRPDRPETWPVEPFNPALCF